MSSVSCLWKTNNLWWAALCKKSGEICVTECTEITLLKRSHALPDQFAIHMSFASKWMLCTLRHLPGETEKKHRKLVWMVDVPTVIQTRHLHSTSYSSYTSLLDEVQHNWRVTPSNWQTLKSYCELCIGKSFIERDWVQIIQKIKVCKIMFYFRVE